MEFVLLERFGALLDQSCRLMQGPTIQHVHLFHGNQMLGGIKIEEIGKLKTECIAEKPVSLADIFQNLVINRDVITVILRSDPQSYDIGTVLRDVGVRSLRFLIGAAFGDFLPVLVDDESMGEHGLVRCGARYDDAAP